MAIAIVTGASQGFGLALTAQLVARGWSVVVDARDGGKLAAATERLDGSGSVHAVAGDVADPRHRDELLDVARRLGGLDLLVHNASELGPSPLPPLAEYPHDALARVFEVNVLAPVALTQRAIPLLQSSPSPTVVAVSSDAAVEAYEGWGGYGASKAALDHAFAIFAKEQPGLCAYVFDPGDMRTAMHQRAFPGEDISDRQLPERVVPALLRLLSHRLASGRYRAVDLARENAA